MEDWIIDNFIWVIIGFFVIMIVIFGSGAYREMKAEQAIMARWEATYDVKDVRVVLTAIDASWSDFDQSPTLRKCYENVRDGKESLGEIKKKKNTTSYVPIVIPVGR